MSRRWFALASLILFGCLGGSGPVDPADAGPQCTSNEDCDDEIFCNGLELCAPDEASALPNGCLLGTPPCGDGTCLEDEDRCETVCPDVDGDGQEDAVCGGTDCDDGDRNVFLGATEVCDQAGVDDDCDPSTLGIDADGDGYPSTRCCNGPPTALRCGGDCDDSRPSANPDAPEVCNGADDDCDGSLDEGVTLTFYRDADGDSYGDVTVTMEACSPPTGWTILSGDCDDANPNISPGRPESCVVRGADDDCDGNIDEVCDCSPADPPITCGPGAPLAGRGVCRDGTQTCSSAGTYGDCMGGVYPGEETCDGLDEDCDGRIDEGSGRACAQNASVSGTTVCGRAGVRRCGADCQWLDGEFLAPGETAESCDYCADTASGTAGERPYLNPGNSRIHFNGGGCIAAPPQNCRVMTRLLVGEATEFALNDGNAATEAGGLWTTSYVLPYGGARFSSGDVGVEAVGSPSSTFGFSLAVVEDVEPVIGPADRFGVPNVPGIRAVWRHSSGPGVPARVSVIREPEGVVLATRDIWGVDFDVADPPVQSITIEVVPDDPGTPAVEGGVVVRFVSGSGIFGGSAREMYRYECFAAFLCPVGFELGQSLRGVLGAGGTSGATRRVSHSAAWGMTITGTDVCPG